MIQFAETQHKNALMKMWKSCFPQDTETFIEWYFRNVYHEEESLIAIENNQPVAFVQMIPYDIKLGNDIRPSIYLSGVMTHLDYRNRGYMRRLVQKALEETEQKAYHYAFLIPQEEKLFDLYAKYGFQRAFSKIEYRSQAENFIANGKFQSYTSYNESDSQYLYSIYDNILKSYPNVVLKTKKQFDNILWDFFNEKGSLYVADGEMIFSKPAELQSPWLCKYGNNTGITIDCSHYKGMIKSVDGSVPPKDVFMIQMLD
ncbi:MAG: GNAT family N-acetyltransferase [Candidatus Symbiothrix sp.]|jgi:predicted acetyltransferase|nr:GNAT family N-acetyltransferase [Candidatus Symbiothrix sp.]